MFSAGEAVGPDAEIENEEKAEIIFAHHQLFPARTRFYRHKYLVQAKFYRLSHTKQLVHLPAV